MPQIKVVVAHPEVLYKQALANSLSLFENITVVNQARYYDEVLNIIKNELPDFVIASQDIFGTRQRIVEAADLYPNINFIILTKRSEDALTNLRPNVQGFLTFGYLIDLYRMIILSAENKKFAQPAVIKNVLSNLRKLEETGIATETLLFDLDQKKLSILVDIILGKGFEEICFKHNFTADELNLEIEKILDTIKSLIDSQRS